jgi:hypothetical protein
MASDYRMQRVVKSEGSTPSERYLSQLCESSFLGLWAYPNVFTDEGRKDAKGAGEELCDLLVVYGDHVIIFSDKHIEFQLNRPISIAWPRWYKRAIEASARQVSGAEKWIREHPHRIYLDKQCQHPFPLDINSTERLHIHRVLVTRGSKDAAKGYFDDQNGSLFLNFQLRQKQHYEHPFMVGWVGPKDDFFHVFDEVTLDTVLGELDTPEDFVSYLMEKEKVITQAHLVSAAGEEELLAHYFRMGGAELRADMSAKALDPSGECANYSLTSGLWAEYVGSEEYKSRKEFCAVSYAWDNLLRRISNHILDGTAIGPDPVVATHERVLRIFASECRLSRTLLAKNFLDKLFSVPSNRRSSRLCQSPMRPDTAFIFLFYPREGEAYEPYRKSRQELAFCYAYVAKLKFPHIRFFGVVGTEPQGSGERSEDYQSFDIPQLSAEEKEMAMRLMNEDRILSDVIPISANNVGRAQGSGAFHRGSAFPEAWRREGAKVGRNTPCPCGSKKKYKKCCGDSRV